MVDPDDIPMSPKPFGRLITDALDASAEWRNRRVELFTRAQSILVASETMRQATLSTQRAQEFVAKARVDSSIGRFAIDSSASRLAFEIGREQAAGKPNPGVNLADLSGRVAAMFESVDIPSEAWRKTLARRLEEIPNYRPMFQRMQEATNAFMEGQRSLDERADDFVASHGWPLPLRLYPKLFGQIVGHAGAPKREVNALMVETFRPGTRAYNLTREVLLESPHLESRSVLLKQAMKAFRREEWYLVINGLLPLVEGVLVDVVYANDQAPDKGRPQKSIKKLQAFEAEIFYSPLVRGLEVMLIPSGAGVALFAGFNPGDYGRLGEPRNLNRNAILHGAARRYGSRQNALKLYLLLVMLAEVLQHYEQLRNRSGQVPDPRL